MESDPFFLTGNTGTVSLFGILDLETDGPTVIEVPPGCGPGTVDDAFFRFVTDMSAPGLMAFYQIGCAIVAFGVGPLQTRAGLSLRAIFGGTAMVALAMAALSFVVVKRQPSSATA